MLRSKLYLWKGTSSLYKNMGLTALVSYRTSFCTPLMTAAVKGMIDGLKSMFLVAYDKTD